MPTQSGAVVMGATGIVPPDFLKTIENTEASIGYSISFQAVVSGSPQPSIQWLDVGYMQLQWDPVLTAQI